MKKFLLTIALALPCLAASQQTASAWSSFKFGIGANIEYSGGGNSLLWGAVCGSPFPGCGYPACAPCGPYGPYGAPAIIFQPTLVGGCAPAADGYAYQAPAQAPTSRAVYYAPQTGYGYYPTPSYGYGW